MTLAFRNCLAEDVGIGSVVVAEREFGDVERHVFLADFRANCTASWADPAVVSQ